MKTVLAGQDATIACSISTRVPHGEECCGDSGAIDDMFPDYTCFASYTKLSNKFALLGDDHLVPIQGYGTNIYCLNGKVVKTRNALHVPALQGPLFSLRRHHQRLGYGLFTSQDLGSFILFPSFIL